MNHFNKLKDEYTSKKKENNQGWKKALKILSEPNTKNKGWAFVTFSTAVKYLVKIKG